MSTQLEPIPGVLFLGLGHKARHGKNMAAQAMVERAPADVLQMGFADALYDYCRVEHGMTTKDPALLQKYGMILRERDPDVWVKAVYWKARDRAVSETGRDPKAVVITDLRFPNEAAFIKSMGGYCIKIERRHSDGTLFQTTDRDTGHISETALDDYPWDLVITNYDVFTTKQNAVVALNYFRDVAAGKPHGDYYEFSSR